MALLTTNHLTKIFDKIKSLVFNTNNIADGAITADKLSDEVSTNLTKLNNINLNYEVDEDSFGKIVLLNNNINKNIAKLYFKEIYDTDDAYDYDVTQYPINISPTHDEDRKEIWFQARFYTGDRNINPESTNIVLEKALAKELKANTVDTLIITISKNNSNEYFISNITVNGETIKSYTNYLIENLNNYINIKVTIDGYISNIESLFPLGLICSYTTYNSINNKFIKTYLSIGCDINETASIVKQIDLNKLVII